MRYAEDVIATRVLAGKWVRLACKRFLNDLELGYEGWTYCYNEQKANAVCAIIEIFPHEKGELQGEPVRLGDWQCFIFCNLFGWVNRTTGFRRFREALIMVPRGNGKSPMAAWFTVIMAFFDGEGGSEVYNAATTEDQAMEVFRPAKAIVEMLPDLQEEFGIEVNAKSLYQATTRSRVKPVIGKPKDGKAPHGVTNDEYHEQIDDKLYDSFKRGMNKRRQSLLFNVSTAGDTIEGPCYRMQQDVQLILERSYENQRMFGMIFDVDEGVDWTTRDALVMANPNFGVSIDEEAMLSDQAEAVRNSAKQNGFRCKNQNFWAQQASAWMNMQSWRKCKKDINEEQFLGATCHIGSDLASTLDLSATVKLFTRIGENGKPIYSAFCRAYLPKSRAFDPARPHLQGWTHDKFLTATEGSAIDYKLIEDETVADIERFKVKSLCFDQRYAGQWAQQINARTGIDTIVVAPSPSELSPAMVELEGAVEEGRFEHDGNPVFTWCMSNMQARRNAATGNYHMPTKDEPEKKIDVAIALLIAMTQARLTFQAHSIYETRGVLTF